VYDRIVDGGRRQEPEVSLSTALQQRRIPFAFDETTPFLWQPENAEFAHLANVFSLLAVGLERYIVAVMRDAMPLIVDQDALDEAIGFLKQEARHAAAHVLHLKALMANRPQLQEVLDGCTEWFERLQVTESLEFRLAFIASLEATFTPFFKVFLDHPGEFFAPGDDRVASLFLWHFIEEVEHRSSALIVFDAVVDDRWYKLKVFPRALYRSSQVVFQIAEGIDRVVPIEDRGISAVEAVRNAGGILELGRRIVGRSRGRNHMLTNVPSGELLRMNYRVVRSQTWGHDPEHQPLPAYADVWRAAFDRGVDVTHWYGTTGATR
jgi:ring-1,2-phenylacetyl-CoA epoxidase subunit PaaE